MINMDDGSNFLDAKTHAQPVITDYIDTGYPVMNRILCGSENGGYEKGCLNVIIGASNVGKSIWLGNMAINSFLSGKNVILISLEMRVHKFHKRLGSAVFGIPMSEYTKYSNDEKKLQEIINKYVTERKNKDLPMGKLITKKFSHATSEDIKAFTLSVEETYGEKFDIVYLDYLNEVHSSVGVKLHENSYQYHKTNARELYEMAEDIDVSVTTPFQLKIAGFGEDDIFLDMMGESSGVIHSADNIMGIIQSPNMKEQNKYYMKFLKLRDAELLNYKMPYDISYSYMKITEQLCDPLSPSDIIA
jgi:KaiC/GvpD/RAD55 family RecA-like ATPase